jgi:hypothetical protein
MSNKYEFNFSGLTNCRYKGKGLVTDGLLTKRIITTKARNNQTNAFQNKSHRFKLKSLPYFLKSFGSLYRPAVPVCRTKLERNYVPVEKLEELYRQLIAEKDKHIAQLEQKLKEAERRK